MTTKSIKKIDGQEFINRSKAREEKLKEIKRELEEDEKKLINGGVIQSSLTNTISRNTIPTNKRNKRLKNKINEGVQEELETQTNHKKELSEWNIFVKNNFKNVQGDTFGEKMKNLKELFQLVN